MEIKNEFEAKVIITKEQFLDIAEIYGITLGSMILQKNYYYDTQEYALHKQGCVVRVRQKGNKFEITFKNKIGENSYEEHNGVLSDFDGLKLEHSDIASYRSLLADKGVDYEKLTQIGTLSTQRYQVKFEGYTIELDHSSYNGHEDYEIECEANSVEEAHKAIQDFCKHVHIEYKPNNKTKYQRFMETKK